MAGKNIENVVAQGGKIVALCDVDDVNAAGTYQKFPDVPKYRDFRKMLEKQKDDIDAVIVATPDHFHAVAAMAAMRLGKHVYVQKPLTHSVYEARRLTEAAREYKVMTQMGNQGHSGEGCRLVCEWIWDGAIGDVREVHAWTDRPIWPQGIERPQDTPPTPDTLDWDVWLGPAPQRPYHPSYLPFNWRGWWDFGTGALGDMACHILDPVVWALKLGYPKKVWAESTPVNSETAPLVSQVHYEFPARSGMPEVKMTWNDGRMLPVRPECLEPDRRMGVDGNGVLFIGDKGVLMCGAYGESPQLIPVAAMQAYKRPAKTIERIPEGQGQHEGDWLRACKDGKPACSNFDVAGYLTEIILLGNLAIRTGKQLDWDGPTMTVTNVPEANQYVKREYRSGWSL
jgi:predicted dehydrogenase